MPLSNLGPSAALSSRTLQAALVNTLREAIVHGHLAPGQKLDQTELANHFGVSRMPVREALRTLAAEGLVDFSPHRGATVAALDGDELDEIFFIRASLEALAGRLATPRLTAERLQALAAILAEMEAVAERDHQAWLTLNDRFHFTIYEAAVRPRLLGIINNLRNTCSPYIRIYISSTANIAQSTIDHCRIFQALEANDPQAVAQAIYEHVTTSGKAVAAQVRQAASPTES